MKILAVKNRMGIGDMVIFLPFIESIAKKYGCPISILVKENSKASKYLNNNPNISEIIILDIDNKSKKGRHDGIEGAFLDGVLTITGDESAHLYQEFIRRIQYVVLDDLASIFSYN